VGVAAKRGGRRSSVQPPRSGRHGRVAGEVDAYVGVGLDVEKPLRTGAKSGHDDVAVGCRMVHHFQDDEAPLSSFASDVFKHQQPVAENDAKPGPVEPDGGSDEPSNTEQTCSDPRQPVTAFSAHAAIVAAGPAGENIAVASASLGGVAVPSARPLPSTYRWTSRPSADVLEASGLASRRVGFVGDLVSTLSASAIGQKGHSPSDPGRPVALGEGLGGNPRPRAV
jgi:hypothetical protein